MLSSFCINARAVASGYTDVLSDLSKDKTFDVSNYPDDPNDKSLQVISIAEGVRGELYLYVYQPCNATRDYRASYINMANEALTDKNIKYQLYSLTWLNSNGVFDKYLVNGFNVKDDAERYYNIAGIYRPFEDDDDSNDLVAVDTKQYKSYSVGQAWCAYYYNGALVYEMEKMNVFEYKVFATGSLRYKNGLIISNKVFDSATDSFYIAFGIGNFDVDKIFDADITYTLSTFRKYKPSHLISETTVLIDSKPVTKTLTNSDTASNNAVGLLGKKYSWERIQIASVFKEQAQKDANEYFSPEETEALDKSQFVFRFEESYYEYEYDVDSGFMEEIYSECSNFGILRIHFLTADGEFYNLGAVGDLVGVDSTPELDVSIPDNILNTIEDLTDASFWQKIMMVLGIIILLLIIVIFSAPIKGFFKIILNGIRFLFQCIIAIVSAPFDFIVALLRK